MKIRRSNSEFSNDCQFTKDRMIQADCFHASPFGWNMRADLLRILS
jgi:hypothetical protein